MNKREFIERRSPDWKRFDKLVRRLEQVGQRAADPGDLAEFSRLYRTLSYDLALLNAQAWGRALVEFLNNLVARGHNCLYRAPSAGWLTMWQFLSAGFPRTFRRNIRYFLAAAALFFVPFVLSWVTMQRNPSLAVRVLPAEALENMESMYSRDFDEQIKGESFADSRATMAGFYVQHNVGIALACFGRGILFGIGTVYTLIENGIILGTVTGYVISRGHGDRFLSFVISHGSFELTAIVVAGGAGLILGHALVHPGRRTRLEALRVRGLEAIQIAGGAAVMLMVAALIEAFWSPAPISADLKYTVGTLLWLLVFAYLTFAGRTRGAA